MNGSTKKIISVITPVLKAFVLFFFILSHVATAAEIYYYHNDHLGTPQVMTDENADIVWQADYTPFGKADVVVETVMNNIRFPGQYFDKETGLHYNYFRDYDPDIGGYAQSDPIGLAGGINTYSYAYQNPISNYDPDGLLVCFGACTIPAAIALTRVVQFGYRAYNAYRAAQTLIQLAEEANDAANDEGGSCDGDESVDYNPTVDTIETGRNRAGKPRIKIKKPDGSVVDMTEDRIKKDVLEPRNPNGGNRPHKWNNPQPGTKGKKRNPTPNEIKFINKYGNY
jgi:RHS repeat-associated protein